MSRILSIDYGKKRTGIAVTDPLQIIAHPLETVDTKIIYKFLENYFSQEEVETVVIGHPKHLDNTDADIMPEIIKFKENLERKFPKIFFVFFDERYTSKRAVQTMVQAGIKKSDRRNKKNIDKIAASIILQDYLSSIKH